jgi:glycosyltransferase involved in cell wall biosynthesis
MTCMVSQTFRSRRTAEDGVLVLDLVGADGLARALVKELVTQKPVDVVRPTVLLDHVLKRRQVPSRSQLVVLGAPPQDGIGYSLVPLLAIAVRAKTVTLVDVRMHTTESSSLGRYVLASAPLSAAQLVVSGLAVAAQRIVARPRLLTSGDRRRVGSGLKRLLYLLPSVGTTSSVGGAVTHAHGMQRALDQLGIDVIAVTNHRSIADTAAAEADFPFRWKVVPTPRLTNAVPASTAFGLDVALTAATRQAIPFDLVYQRHTRFSVVGALAARAARVPFFLEFNSPAEFFHPSATVLSRQRQRCEDAALRSATRVFVVSEVAKDLVLQRGLREEQVIVNPNGVDLERFDPKLGGASVRKQLGFLAEDVVFGFVGSFMAFHGAVVLAKSFVEVAQTCPNARLLLVGDGDERPKAARILRELLKGGRVKMAGRVSPSDVPSYVAACDVLVSPHVPFEEGKPFHGSPTKLFEYMAAGRAIVASCLGQIADVLEHERTALLVEPGNPAELTAALLRVAGDDDLRRSLGSAARSEVRGYTWIAHAQRVVDAFEALPRIEAKQ